MKFTNFILVMWNLRPGVFFKIFFLDTEFSYFKMFYLFMSALSLPCFLRLSLVAESGSYFLVSVHGLLVAVASVVVEHSL